MDNLAVCGVACLVDAESVEDLRRKLREKGYSIKAVEEILKWYKPNSSDG